MNLDTATIYIGIASYRDPYLERTIKSIYNQAVYPQRIRTHCFIQKLENDNDVIPQLTENDFKIPGILDLITYEVVNAGSLFSIYECRNRSFKFLNKNYDYALQIDAHNQFHAAWDLTLLSMYNIINDPQAIVSVKLPHWHIINDKDEYPDIPKQNIATEVDFRNEETKKTYVNHNQWFGYPKDNTDNNVMHHRSWYLFGGFIFGKPDFFLLKKPEWLHIRGEELLDSIRAFTGGWNAYSIKYVPIFHLYTHGYSNFTGISRRHIFHDFTDEARAAETNSSKKVKAIIFNKKTDGENILEKRTLEDFYNFLGYSLQDLMIEWEKKEHE